MEHGMFKLKDNVKRWMSVKNPPWTGQMMARALGYDASFISEIFSGKRQPSWQFLRRVADLTGLHDGGELLYYDQNGGEAPKLLPKKEVEPDERNNDIPGAAGSARGKRPGMADRKRRDGRTHRAGDTGLIPRRHPVTASA